MSSYSHIAQQNQVITWINEAGMLEGGRKANLLIKIKEILLNQVPQMIPTVLDNILSFGNDKSTEVKKHIINFIEQICKLHTEYIPQVIPQYRLLLQSDSVVIQKRVIQGAAIVYKYSLLWISQNSDDDIAGMKTVWDQLIALKLQILNMIDSENEGIRTCSIKFLESVIIIQTYDEIGTPEEFSLDKIPDDIPFLKKENLEDESEHIFTLLLKFHNSQHISSVNLMACMSSLCNLAKVRPKYMPRVIQALTDLHTTLPPTLSQSQVNSVRKHLKMLLTNIIKHPTSGEMLPHFLQLMSDIGMSNQEIHKLLPKDKRNKRISELKNTESAKRPRLDSPQSNSQSSDSFTNTDDSNDMFVQSQPTEETLCESLNSIDKVVNLVEVTLKMLPDEMPQEFKANYKPIPNAGTMLQKRHLAKMILALVKGEQPILQKSLSELTSKIPLLRDDADEKTTTLKNAVAKLAFSGKVQKLNKETAKLREESRREHLAEQPPEPKIPEPPTPTVPKLKSRVKQLKLQEITRPVSDDMKEKFMLQAVQRILEAEDAAQMGGVTNIRNKLIVIFASTYTPEIRELVLEYIFRDPKSRIDLALLWLYEEFSYMQGFSRLPVSLVSKNQKHDYNYNNLLCALITQIGDRVNPKFETTRDVLLRKIYMESPIVTEDAIGYLKHLVSEEGRTMIALELLEEIVMRRPTKATNYISALLCHTVNDKQEIRDLAIQSVIKIYNAYSDSMKKVIEKHAKLYLGFIPLTRPPFDLFDFGSMDMPQSWTDELYKSCISLILALFMHNFELIMDIAQIYGHSTAEGKRCLLRSLELPLRTIMKKETKTPKQFLNLIDECPKGAETLITRVVHIITEKAPPSKELVNRIRDMYVKQVSDVRFLIPVLNGLNKDEIVAALPKLIKLNPVVLKEVFNKLLGLYRLPEENLPLSPVDLLVELHLIDQSQCELKYVIKATGMCFAEKQIYTQDVMSQVLERLIEEPEIPVLLMRTLLQALSLYPAMVSLVVSILPILVSKQVWMNKVIWEGFVKCCERTSPSSLNILLTLPLSAIEALSPTLKTSLSSHVALMTPAQRSCLPPNVVQMFLGQHGGPVGVPAPDTAYNNLQPVGIPPPDFDIFALETNSYTPQNLLEPLPPGME